MNRTGLNFVVDLTAAVLFLGMAATGYVLWFVLPPGTQKELSLWGVTRHGWGTVHAWLSFGLLGTVLFHVCLHWLWVVSVVRKRLHLAGSPQGSLWRSGLTTAVLLAVVCALFAWVVQTGVRPVTDPEALGVCPSSIGGENREAEPAYVPGPSTAVSRPSIAFWNDVYPVLEKSCLSCHGPSRARGNFRVDRREDYFGSAGKEALVVPGESGRSALIPLVSGQRNDVPRPEVHRLPETDVAVLRAWIDTGAEWSERPARK
jgi:Domain of unknown function (DUF4405)/Planctomycete cytochrome C